MENKRFINVQDVVEEFGVSTSYAYKLIRELNAERAADGFVTIKGRVSRQYFDERIYGTTDNMHLRRKVNTLWQKQSLQEQRSSRSQHRRFLISRHSREMGFVQF